MTPVQMTIVLSVALASLTASAPMTQLHGQTLQSTAPAESQSTNPSAAPTTPSVPNFSGRRGPLTPRERAMAEAAWSYFVAATQEKTGLVNSVKTYPSTTLWDTASYISALVAARELGIIDKNEFDLRTFKLLGTVRDLDLFRGELPNKVYNTATGQKVNYANQPGEIGYSALDAGRMMTWLRILKQRYPYFSNSVDGVLLRWNYCHVIDEKGQLFGAGVGGKGETLYFQEGRLGYEEYSAKGFGLWGFKTVQAERASPVAFTDIYGVKVPYDSRDPRVFKTQNYVLAEAYLLEGIELNWDLALDNYTDEDLHSDGWRAEFAQRVYLAQQRRFEETGILTARTEHQVEGDPFFVYDTVFADGYAWNTLSPQDEYVPARAAVAVKGALGMWVLWNNSYTDKLFEAVAELYTKDGGFYEGVYENGSGYIPLQTANNNGIILAVLLYKAQGPIWKHVGVEEPEAWFTYWVDEQIRDKKCLPEKPVLTECPVASACGPQQPKPALVLNEYQYCEPVSASSWFPGCPLTHAEPAARNCQVKDLRRVSIPSPPATPGSMCMAPPLLLPTGNSPRP
jgi:Protein of unknown function (DUF3131)